MAIIFLKDRFAEEKEGAVHSILAFKHGVFETLRTYNGKVSNFDMHYERLRKGCKKLGLKPGHGKRKILEIIKEVIRRNNLKDHRVRAVVTQEGMTVTYDTLERYPAAVYKKGVSALITNFRRHMPEVKSTAYGPCVLALELAKKKGFFEGLLVSKAGYITEGASSNIFLVKGDAVITPGQGMLHGVTRRIALQLVRKNTSFKMVLRKVSRKDLYAADEIFLTNTTGEIIPVVKVNNRKVRDGKIGNVTGKMMRMYKGFIRGR